MAELASSVHVRDSRGRERIVPAWAVLVICCMAQFMVVLDVSIVNVALPSMQHALDLSPAGLQWVVNAYTLAFAGLLLFGGRAADLFGRKRIFLLGITLFTVASLAGGFAQSSAVLIAARGFQGLGGAVLAPATLTLLTTTYVDPVARNKALGLWGAVAAGGGAFGAVAGGVLTDFASWRWVLFVNVPIGALMYVAARWALPESKGQVNRIRDLDVPGTLTVTLGLVALVYAIVRTDTYSWGSWQTLIVLALAAALLVSFVTIEQRQERPLVPLRILRVRPLSAANVIVLFLGGAMFAFFFFVTLYVQEVLGFSPLKAGLAFLPASAMIIVGAQATSRLIGRVGPRPLLVAGTALSFAGLLWLSHISATGSFSGGVLGPSMIVGFGLGTCMIPTTIVATAGVAPAEAGLASGLVNSSRQVGAAIGLAVLSTIATQRTADLVAGHPMPVAVTDGYARALLVGSFFMLAGLAITFIIPRVGRPAPVTAPPAAEPVVIEADGGPQPFPDDPALSLET